MNYSEIKSAVDQWTHRADLSPMAVTFVQLAEERMNRTLRVNALATTATLTVLSGASSVALPADYQEGRSLTASDGEWTQCTPEQLEERRAAGSADKAYAIFGGSLHLPFAVGSDTALTLAYWTRVPALSDTNTENWVSTNHPGLYMWLTLAEAAVFVGSAASGSVFEARALQAMRELNDSEVSARYFAAALQSDYVV